MGSQVFGHGPVTAYKYNHHINPSISLSAPAQFTFAFADMPGLPGGMTFDDAVNRRGGERGWPSSVCQSVETSFV